MRVAVAKAWVLVYLCRMYTTSILDTRQTPVSTSAPVFWWLVGVAVMIFLMVVVGGATRLTESGLSITHWSPISGTIPPLTPDDWQREFALYQQTDEYRLEHAWMQLADFQQIYWWEWGHRVLGRLIGMVYALPFFWFLWRGQLPRTLVPRFWAMLALGGLQGAIGWWMVASGLVGRTDVSHYRLAVHLLMALLIFSLVLWTALDLRPGQGSASRSLKAASLFTLALLPLQIGLGAFVAGLNAGYAFNTWPLMGDRFAPDGLWTLTPLWLNLVENPVTVQFLHRCLAYGVFAVGIYASALAWRAGFRMRGLALAGTLSLQVVLGIAALLSGVPVWLGVAHQAGGVLLLASALWVAHAVASLRRPAAHAHT